MKRFGFARCFSPRPATMDIPKFGLFSWKAIKKSYDMIPLIAVNMCVLLVIPLISYHRMFVSTIDVQWSDRHRFEMPSIPKFFDLRNPRNLKLVRPPVPWKPAIHLDNRYRLMRNEPMLDADGKKTNEIGEDETSVDPEELFRASRSARKE